MSIMPGVTNLPVPSMRAKPAGIANEPSPTPITLPSANSTVPPSMGAPVLVTIRPPVMATRSCARTGADAASRSEKSERSAKRLFLVGAMKRKNRRTPSLNRSNQTS